MDSNPHFPDTLLKDELAILVLSHKSELLEQLQTSIHETWKQIFEKEKDRKKFLCKVHITQDILKVLNQQTVVPFDYVIFLVECEIVGELEWIENQVRHLGLNFGRHKICIVPLDADYSTPISPEQLWMFAKSYQFNILMGSLQSDIESCHLSRRILTLAEKCCGLHGAPLVGFV